MITSTCNQAHIETEYMYHPVEVEWGGELDPLLSPPPKKEINKERKGEFLCVQYTCTYKNGKVHCIQNHATLKKEI